MYGGQPAEDQRIYYFNMKELVGQKYGTASPIPFRVLDERAGIDIDISLKCFGEYSLKVTDPILFYTNVCGNVENVYTRDQIERQLKTEFISALQPAFAKISELQIRPSAIPGHAEELSEAMNEALSKKWSELRGLDVVSIIFVAPSCSSSLSFSLCKPSQYIIGDEARKAISRGVLSF
jgi:membrane protease subunit (stomatin/prohibitin family)